MATLTSPEASVEDASAGTDGATLARGGTINFAGALSYAVLNFAVIAVVTRNLGAEGAGAFLEAVAAFSILARSSMIGADIGLVRFVSRYSALDRSASIRPTIVLAVLPVALVSTVLAVGLFVAAAPLGRVLASSSSAADVTTYLRILAPFIPVSAVYQTLDACARGFGTMVPTLVVERIGRPLLVPAFMLAVFAAGMGSSAVALAWATPWAIALVPTALWVHHLLGAIERRGSAPEQQRRPGRNHLNRVFWRFTAPRSLGAVFQVGILWADTLLIGGLASTREAGVYAASTRWLVAGQFAGAAISAAFAPQISAVLSMRDIPRASLLFERATAWFVLIAWPAYLTVMIFGGALVSTFGRGFGAGARVLLIVGAAYLFAAAAGPVDIVLLMGGRSTLSLVNNVIALTANIALNILLIPRLGLQGAAMAWAVSLLLTNGLPMLQVWRGLDLHPFGSRWLVAVLTASTVGIIEVVVRALMGPGLGTAFVGVAAAGTGYGLLVWRLRDRLDVDSFVAGLRRDRKAVAG